MKRSCLISACLMVLMFTVGAASADSVFQTSNMLLGEAGYITKTPSPSVSFGTSGITLSGIVIDNPSSQIAPPAGVGASVSSFFDVFTELTLDGVPGGVSTFTVSHSPSTVRYTTLYNGHLLDPPVPIMNIATEMLQLNIAGGNLPGGIMIRESPTRASTGGTTITDIPGGGFMVDSFFDIFTELTMDGGQTWHPADRSLRISTITPEPATFGLLVLGGLGLIRRKRA